MKGEFNSSGLAERNVTFIIERSIGPTCYVKGYFASLTKLNEEFDTIGFQSAFLDDIFRYKYVFLDEARSDTNLSKETKIIYNFPFTMNGEKYDMEYVIGKKSEYGLLESFDKKGEIYIKLKKVNGLNECIDLATVFYRLAMFMTFDPYVPFKVITLYKGKHNVGWFYSPFVDGDAVSVMDFHFHDLNVNKYIPKILNNIAQDPGNIVTKSIPLTHLKPFKEMYSPNHLVEQVTAFEYLFYKLEPEKSKDRGFPLKKELEYSFNMFPEILGNRIPADKAGEIIKKIRVDIVHGYASYYDFKGTHNEFFIIIMDELIKRMSLKLIGFSNEEIKELSFL